MTEVRNPNGKRLYVAIGRCPKCARLILEGQGECGFCGWKVKPYRVVREKDWRF